MRRVILSSLLLFLVGCGYSFRALDPSLRTVYIAPVKNKLAIASDYSSTDELKKYYPNLEVEIRRALMDRFLTDGSLKLTDAPSADVQVEVVLVDYTREPLGYTNSDEVNRWRIKVGADVLLKVGDRTVQRRMYGQEVYDQRLESERVAVRSAVDDLVRKIADAVFTFW